MKNKNFPTQQDPFARNAQDKSKIFHEILLSMKRLQTKPEIKNLNIKYHDLYYTVFKFRDQNKDIDNQYENDDNDCIILMILFLIISLGLNLVRQF